MASVEEFKKSLENIRGGVSDDASTDTSAVESAPIGITSGILRWKDDDSFCLKKVDIKQGHVYILRMVVSEYILEKLKWVFCILLSGNGTKCNCKR